MDEKEQEIQELADEKLDEVAGGGFRGNKLSHEFYCTKCKRKYFSNKKSVSCKKCKATLTLPEQTNSLKTF